MVFHSNNLLYVNETEWNVNYNILKLLLLIAYM